jgi:hypothetical protein
MHTVAAERCMFELPVKVYRVSELTEGLMCGSNCEGAWQSAGLTNCCTEVHCVCSMEVVTGFVTLSYQPPSQRCLS